MYILPYVAEELVLHVAEKDLLLIKIADDDYFDDNKTNMRQKLKIQSFLEDKDVEVKEIQRNLKSSKWNSS